MKKVVQVVFVSILLICIYRHAKIGGVVSFVQETEKEDYASEMDRETENETVGQIWSTVIGEVEILEKSLQATIEVEGWSRVRTWDLKYPYFSGDQVVLLKGINNQIYEWVRERNMDDSEGLYYIELTYEITYMDEHFVSILFEGDGGGSSYYGYSHGMSFDLKTGELLSLTDFYEWSGWKELMENAMEQGQLRTQILRGDIELEEDENREYLEEYFIPLFQEDSDFTEDNLDFYIKGGYLYFITSAYPSCREDSYVKWEVPLEMEAFESGWGSVPGQIDDMRIQEEQGEENVPLLAEEEFHKIMECLDEQVPEIWNEWADYIREQSGGEAHLIERMAGEYLPDDVYRDYEHTEYLGKYYMVYVGEIWEDHSVNWEYFYVSEDFSEVLLYDIIMYSEYPVLYLDEWRNSDFYRKLDE